MADKSETVRVPRELLETIEKSWRVPHGCPAAIYEDVNDIIRAGLADLRALLAAPAEVVRAVVEEPVACYVATDDLEAIHDGSRMWATAWASDSSLNPSRSFSEPLYRHPQRPVVMPERLREVWLFLDGQAELNGCVFGEKPEDRHNFWWRKELRAVLKDLYPQQ